MDLQHRRIYNEVLFDNLDKMMTELNLVYKLRHNGEKGREAEGILKAFLETYMPKKYEITTGFVIGDMGISNQCDIIMYDPSHISPVYSGYENKIININCLRGVIECKMQLTYELLNETNEKFGQFKKLYRNDAEVKECLLSEPISVLFAYKSSQAINIRERLDENREKNIDIIFCADGKLYILDKTSANYTANIVQDVRTRQTAHGYNLTKEKEAFAIFYSHLLMRMNEIKNNYEDYSPVRDFMNSYNYIDFEEN